MPREIPSILNFLIVEDEPSNRDLLIAIVTHLGHRAHWAENGLEAMAALQEAAPPIDVVLLDIQMPCMDGFGVLADMRAESRMRGIPVICVSALAREEDRLKASAAGADGFVVKPFRIQELIAAVDAALRRKRVLGPDASITRLTD